MEVEQSGALNFLDLKIYKNNSNLEFGIYHKPTATDTVIHSSSNHPHNHKMASFNSYVYRLLKYPLSFQEYNKEVNYIKTIAFNNGYQPKIIDHLICTIEKKLKIYGPKNKYKYFVSNYIDRNSSLIAQAMHNPIYKPAYKTTNKLGQLINKKQNHNPLDEFKKTGVYLIKCKDPCKKKYIGYTMRNFNTRYNEHTKHKTHKNPKSNFARHLKENNCEIGNIKQHLSVLKHSYHQDEAMAYEQYYLAKFATNGNKEDLLNNKEDYKSKPTFDFLIQFHERCT